MRRAGKHILIITEGFCEYQYAVALRQALPRDKQRSVSIDLPKPNNENTAFQLLERAKQKIMHSRRDGNPYDAVWIIFDNDRQPNLAGFFQQLARTTVKVAYSSMCIEHWFMLHLEPNRQAYQDPAQALQDINRLWRRAFRQDYHKTKQKHYDLLKPNMDLAIQRAEAIQQQVEAEDIPMAERNPYFTIHELIDYFRSL